MMMCTLIRELREKRSLGDLTDNPYNVTMLVDLRPELVYN